ncbi:hypothetical protein Pcinc_021068 [Petrolisthes cinctipes]|uniref:Methyltransferase domain-containing protein n=1 Tax=Petrolisthes cinctipes TaxID=88211 RepID=A0AAE1KKF4_PETCI|nr:hypothetical protein Pcinc_021068 [Petrolisthes cinctipes]
MEQKTAEELKALETTRQTFSKGLTPEQVAAKYDDWSSNYEEMLNNRYKAPHIAVDEIANLVPEDQRKNIRVMDVAAGTGLVGIKLREIGFKNIDALEPSEGMIQLLKDTGVYNLKYQEFIGHGKSTVPADTYDLVVIAGGMGHSHIPVSGVDDLVRVAKPGGLVVIVMRLEFLTAVEEYRDKLEPYLDQLEQRGVWHKESRKIVPNYFFEKEGIVFSYRVK